RSTAQRRSRQARAVRATCTTRTQPPSRSGYVGACTSPRRGYSLNLENLSLVDKPSLDNRDQLWGYVLSVDRQHRESLLPVAGATFKVSHLLRIRHMRSEERRVVKERR